MILNHEPRPHGGFRQPLGLVLAGGGALGAWQSGVVYSLVNEFGLRFQHIVGISSGSLTGVAYFLNRLEEISTRWRNVNTARIMRFRPKLRPLSLFSGHPVMKSIEYVANEDRCKKRAQCHYTVVSVCREERRHIYAHFAPEKELWDGPLIKHIAASCAIPLVFPPIRTTIQGKDRLLMDGGVSCPTGMDFRFMEDCEDVLVLEMECLDRPPRQTLLARALSTQIDPDNPGDAMISRGIQSLLSLPKKPRVYRFFPQRPLRFSSLEFREKYCVPAFQQGLKEGPLLVKQSSLFQVQAL
ncbi:MAG: patatin-like phospholipase family protein [Planctomycetota bacterium]|nr:patatin-like phospholipase family protein [Planctomycetota bacterium]